MNINNDISESFFVKEKGVRKPGRHCPHNLGFPSIMSALKTYVGLESRMGYEDGGILDKDYFYHVGVSGEGFGLMYDIYNLLKIGKWDNQFLDDCFISEGIQYRLVADDSIPIKDGSLNRDTIQNEVAAHLMSDLPVITIQKPKNVLAYITLAIGYKNYGETLMVSLGGRGVQIGKNVRAYQSWSKEVCAVIFIDGFVEPIDRKEVILRALKRAYEMLIESKEVQGEYGYGEQMWQKWKNRLNNDKTYSYKSNVLKYISPEKFNLAERRWYSIYFFREAEDYLGKDLLSDAKAAFNEIHEKMWEINWMVTDENKGKLRERDTRDRIIEILKICQTLDYKAAKNIKDVLDKYAILLEEELSTKESSCRTIRVIDKKGVECNPTYLRRAKGLVKGGRAQWLDEKTIQLTNELSE